MDHDFSSHREEPVGIYLHVPFCRSKCGYCDFYSLASGEKMEEYGKILLEEISAWEGQGVRADALYVGGGTPSLLPPRLLAQLLERCRAVFSLAGECTLEANPDSVSLEGLTLLRKAGFNRISFGAQSAVDKELRALGRRHDAAGIFQAVSWAKEAGFSRISLDMMLGIPFQTPESLAQTLDAFTGLGPGHISAYLLKIEEGTPFYRSHTERLCPDEDLTVELYLQTVETLGRKGFGQYEISNFARPGEKSRHNLKYWRCQEYLGFGPAAHSFFQGHRFYHPRGLGAYLAARGKNWIGDGSGGSLEERLMLGLRLTEGVDPIQAGMGPKEARTFLEKVRRYQQRGLMELADGRPRFTPKGFLVSNAILADLLAEE